MTCFALTALLALAASGKDAPTLRYTPPPDAEDDRPVATEVTVKADGSDFTLHILFNREPWGETCKARCANATFFLDTDGNRTTGLQLGPQNPQTGADLSVLVQGVREYKELSADTALRVRVRQFNGAVKDVEEGQTLAELDPRRDPERVKAQQSEVSLRVDATDPNIPAGRTMRVVYQPPGAAPVVGTTPGVGAGTAKRAVKVVKRKRR